MINLDTSSGSLRPLGLLGLGVMGRALALQFADHGYPLVVFDLQKDAAGDLSCEARSHVVACSNIAELLQNLPSPRTILMMVPAGDPVDQALGQLLAGLKAGDIVADGGNSHYKDTQRRAARMANLGLHYLGVGISGGEEGARTGASIMAGGPHEAFTAVRPLLTSVAAQVDGEPCSAWFGLDGAGHFVKMIHNGIEYAVMQLIAETYYVLRHGLRLSYRELADVFTKWSRGPLAGYLLDITAGLLDKIDPDTGKPILDVILDRADQKGTGQWAIAAALEIGAPAPIMAAAVHARALSMLKSERVAAASARPSGPEDEPEIEGHATIDDLERALYGAAICAFSEGFAVLAAAKRHFGWPIELDRVAHVWRGGCILRARLLENIRDAFTRDAGLANLCLDPALARALEQAMPSWRRVVTASINRRLPVPALTAALSHLDGYRRERLWADLIQAQRDSFGRHGFERVDRPGKFHHDWRRP